MKRYSIYKHTLPNGKIYIGCTSRDVEVRWNKGCGYCRNKDFYNDIIAYGWNNIKHEILETNLNRQEAFELEHKLIMECRSYLPEFGYNISCGFGRTGHHVEYSKETRELISQHRKGKRAKENHPMARPVYCIELNKVFAYGKLAEEETGICRAHICQVCKGQRKTAGKMHWRYAD